MREINQSLVLIMDKDIADSIKGKYSDCQLNPLPIFEYFYLTTSILENRTFESIFYILNDLPIKLLTVEYDINLQTGEREAIQTLTDPQ